MSTVTIASAMCKLEEREDSPKARSPKKATSTRKAMGLKRMRHAPLITLALLLFLASPSAQPVFTGAEIFPPDEFAARRARVMERIGDGVAILQGTTERPGEQPLRQNNQFFYLTGVVEPRAIVVIDGRTKKTTLFLQPRNERREQRMFGPGLPSRRRGGDGDRHRRGAARATNSRRRSRRSRRDRRTIYTPFRPEVLGEASSSDPAALARATKEDPWDGRVSREEAFIAKLKARRAGVRRSRTSIRSSTRMRAIKSPREIAVIREATRITGLAIMEAMRDARPGMYEYELQADAEFVFKKYGAYGPSYFALIATGTNTPLLALPPEHRDAAGRRPRAVRLRAGLQVLPVGRDARVSGQRPLHAAAARVLHDLPAALSGADDVDQGARDAARHHQGRGRRRWTRSSASYHVHGRRGSRRRRRRSSSAIARARANSLGHSVGMEVHDVGGPAPTLEPGMIFTIEPAMQIPDEHLGIRLEDMILITESGYENLSAFVPVEPDAIERVMREPGLSKKHP